MLKAAIRLLSGHDPHTTPGTDSPADGRLPAYVAPTPGVYLDTLELRDAILARDIVLQEHPEDGFVIHHVDGCRARRVGAFHGAAAAWAALDAIDDPLAGRRAEPEVMTVR